MHFEISIKSILDPFTNKRQKTIINEYILIRMQCLASLFLLRFSGTVTCGIIHKIMSFITTSVLCSFFDERCNRTAASLVYLTNVNHLYCACGLDGSILHIRHNKSIQTALCSTAWALFRSIVHYYRVICARSAALHGSNGLEKR